MALTYTQTKSNLDDIADRSEQARLELIEVETSLTRVINKLNTLETEYSTFVQEVDTVALNNSTDVIWQNVKAEKDKLVTDFISLRSTANNMKTAIEAI